MSQDIRTRIDALLDSLRREATGLADEAVASLHDALTAVHVGIRGALATSHLVCSCGLRFVTAADGVVLAHLSQTGHHLVKPS